MRLTTIATTVAMTKAAVAQITRAITSAPIRSMSDRNPLNRATSDSIGPAGARKLTAKKTTSGR